MSARIFAIALAVAACSGVAATPSPSTHDITVVITLNGNPDSVAQVGDSCEGTGGYSDMSIGTQFTIKDAAGTLVGFGALTIADYGPRAFECSLQGKATGVPDLPIYSVEVGRRGTVNFQRADLEADGWLARLSLGD